MDIVRFLAEHSPFDALEADRLQHVAGSAQIEFYPMGTTILRGGESDRTLYVVRVGAVEEIEKMVASSIFCSKATCSGLPDQRASRRSSPADGSV